MRRAAPGRLAPAAMMAALLLLAAPAAGAALVRVPCGLAGLDACVLYDEVPARLAGERPTTLDVAYADRDTPRPGDDAVAGSVNARSLDLRPGAHVRGWAQALQGALGPPGPAAVALARAEAPGTASPAAGAPAHAPPFAASTEDALLGAGARLQDACPPDAAAACDAPEALAGLLPEVAVRSELRNVRVALATPAAHAPAPAGSGAAPAAAPRAAGAQASAPGHDVALRPGDDAGFEAPASGSPARAAAADAALAPQAASAAPPASPPDLAALALAGLALAALLVPLYRRIERARALDLPLRRDLFALVEAQPGIHESALAARLAIAHSACAYHVRVLAELGLVEVRRFGLRNCVYPAGRVGRAEKALLAAHGKRAELLRLLAASPGLGQRDLAAALGLRENTVKWHLERLVAQGLVTVEQTPAGKRARLSAEALRAGAGAPAIPAAPAAGEAAGTATA